MYLRQNTAIVICLDTVLSLSLSVLVNGFWPLTKIEGDLIAVPTECNSC